MTLSEWERWRAITIVEIYHQRRPRAIGTTPLQQYAAGILGSAEHPRRGLPGRLLDEARLRLDFMPYAARTVQPQGITLDEIPYYDAILKPWSSAADPSDERGKRKRQFIMRRDPRDISRVYFYAPALKQYCEVPYRLSVWELRAARRRARRALQADPQLASRCEPAALPRWQLHQEFQMLLASFERAVPLRAASRLADAPLARKLLAWSAGSLGELSALLTTAAVDAVTSGVERLDAQALAAITWGPLSERRRQAPRLV
jgi:Mu transposase-like protein